ncbi:MAG: ribosome biogenesis GTPase Der [Candidatus Aureabacteria bacterium]|nr:ribosome biogenesis GTPase Der [Candidatus Auribacterota bacterium]
MHTVAIVGRPNVGKSAIFNRLAGKRIAIVDSTYGLTRDRIAASVSHGGRQFTIIDTGGIDFDASDNVREMAKRQTQLAISQADTVLLVTDAIDGPVPLDSEIAATLRSAGKKVIVAVNKADNEALESAASSFHRLGFPDLLAVSATHGLGIGALMDALAAQIMGEGKNEPSGTLKIAIVGRPNVGKSSYVNRILREERMIVDESPGTTRDSVDIEVSRSGRSVTLIDTAGVRREGSIKEPAEFFSLSRTRGSIRRSDLALMLIDATEGEGVSMQDEKLARYIHDQGKGCVLGVNKWDLARETDTRRYREYVWQKMRFFNYVPLVFMSAKSGQGMERSLDTIFYVCEQMGKRIGTPVLNRVLHNIWERNEPPAHSGKRCKFYYTAQVGIAPPTFQLFVNERKLVGRTYVNYLVNELRRAFGFEGTPLRLEFKNRRREGRG